MRKPDSVKNVETDRNAPGAQAKSGVEAESGDQRQPSEAVEAGPLPDARRHGIRRRRGRCACDLHLHGVTVDASGKPSRCMEPYVVQPVDPDSANDRSGNVVFGRPIICGEHASAMTTWGGQEFVTAEPIAGVMHLAGR